MNNEELKSRLAVLDEEIKTRQDERSEVRQAIALNSTKFRVGNRITWGKDRPVYEIKKIGVGYRGEATFFGAKIKKDGTTGAVCNEIYTWGEIRIAE